METAIAKVIATFLEHGIVGAVALAAIYYAYQQNKEIRKLEAEKLAEAREHAKAKLTLQKEFYERLIESTGKQNERYESVVSEMKETVAMLADSVSYETVEGETDES